MSKASLSMGLPKVGDRLVRIVAALTFPPTCLYEPKPCVVTYVNKDHSWYEVEFINTGVKECYHLPDFDHSIVVNPGSIPIMCVETGNVFPSMTECAKEMKLSLSGVSRQIHGELHHCGGYHFETVF